MTKQDYIKSMPKKWEEFSEWNLVLAVRMYAPEAVENARKGYKKDGVFAPAIRDYYLPGIMERREEAVDASVLKLKCPKCGTTMFREAGGLVWGTTRELECKNGHFIDILGFRRTKRDKQDQE